MSEAARVLDEDVSDLWSQCQDGLRPDSPITLTEWSDRERVLSIKGASAPGKWRTAKTPYLAQIMDSLSASSPIEEVAVMKGSQVGVTEVGVNFAGYSVDVTRVPVIIMQPSLEPVGRRFVKQKLDPMLELTPCLRGKVKGPRHRDGGNSTFMKEVAGCSMMITGANSPAGLRSSIAGALFEDEVDAYPVSAGNEGDPSTLAERALRTYGRRKKILKVSTPLLDGTSRIAREFDAAQRRFFLHVPCPSCLHMQVLEHEHLEWPEGEPEKAAFRCVGCHELIPEHHKTWMLARHEWRAEDGAPFSLAALGAARVKKIAFHLPAYYSPAGWFSWTDAAEMDDKAKLDPELRQILDNTVRGLPHKRSTDAPAHLRLYERREGYPIGLVPLGGLFLTAGVDVQRAPARIEWEIAAWGRGKETWSVDYGVIDGSIADPRVIRELDEVLNRDVPCAGSEGTLPIRVMAIDSGWDAQNVYAWARRHIQPAYGAAGAAARAARTVAVVKGRDQGLRLVWSSSRDDLGGKRRGVRIFQVSNYQALTELYTWLRLEAPTDEDLEKGVTFPPGYCHFPDYGVEYFKQLVAERCVTRVVRGYPQETFELPKGIRNEAADCRKYARAAAELFGISRFNERTWRELEAARGVRHGEEQSTLPLYAKYVATTPPESDSSSILRDEAPRPVPPPVAIHARILRRSRVSSWMNR